MGKPLINAEQVQNIFIRCVRKSLQIPDEKAKFVEGHCIKSYLEPSGFEKEILHWLDALPLVFRASIGGGAHWYHLFNEEDGAIDKNGTPWTYRFGDVEELILLGQAIGRIRFMLPREEWRSCRIENMPAFNGFPPIVYLDRLRRRK